MSFSTNQRARRIAEPGLLAAIAAVVHLADYFLAMGMIGAVVCPLPHVLSVRRHGLRAGMLGALCTICVLAMIGGPVEAGFHLFLFVAPGLTVGWALSGEDPPLKVLAVGTFFCGLGAAGTYYVLEAAMGIPDSLLELGKFGVWAADWAATPFRWAGDAQPGLDFIPGLASLPVREHFTQSLLHLPLGIFLSLGFVVFYTTWFVAAYVVARLGEPMRPPPLPIAPRLPRLLALLYLATFWNPPGMAPWMGTLWANLNLLLALTAYVAGYLNLLAYARGRPLGAMLAMLASTVFYYFSVWIGLLSALRSEADDKAWKLQLEKAQTDPLAHRPGLPWRSS
jgi:hypothetical protein